MTNAKNKLHYIISHAKADVNLCAVALLIISKSPEEERVELLHNFFQEFKNTPTDGRVELPLIIDKEEEREHMGCYGYIMDEYLDDLCKQELSERDFYMKLWEYITENEFFDTQKAKIIALFDCAIDKRLPYYYVECSEALKMDQETYMKYMSAIGEDYFSRMNYILNRKWSQKTEQASLLVKMLDELDEFEMKTVFMSRILSYYQKELRKANLLGIAPLLSELDD